MFRKYVRFLLTNICSCCILISRTEQMFGMCFVCEWKDMGEYNMTVQERNRRSAMKRRKQVAKQKIVLLLATVFVIAIGSVIFGSNFSNAKNSTDATEQYKYYKSVVIEPGDSLWSIAQEYKTIDVTTKEYVDELKELNALKSEQIQEGQHLMVVYYDTELH